MSKAFLQAIEYHLPARAVTTEQLAQEFPDWSVEKIESKTGIRTRYIAATDECASDLALQAAEKLFRSGVCGPKDIDYLILCTQSPDYFLPTTACLLQDRLGLPTSAGALDVNLGCSGYVYGLGLAQGLIETGQAQNVLLITADTYSKFTSPSDRNVRTLFGDGAAATLVKGIATERSALGPYVYGTDGAGAKNLIVPAGGLRCPRSSATARLMQDDSGNERSQDHLYMNGVEIFNFAMQAVPPAVATLLKRANIGMEDVDLFVFHQANRFMLDQLAKRMRLPSEKVYLALSDCGNTVSSSIPIALKEAEVAGSLRSGTLAVLVGFGVGYSWGATVLRC
jgi:3-oxoacyl-[acyl-carrier-protein] synthase-3